MMILSDKTLTNMPMASRFADSTAFWIRTAAGPQIGFGHLRRCVILAQMLEDCCNPLFLLEPEDCWSPEYLSRQGIGFFSQGFENAWSRLPEPNAILIDTRLSNGLSDLIAQANSRRIPVISIHDLGLNPIPSDIIIDGSIAPALPHNPRPDNGYFKGTDYMILDPAFRRHHQQSKPIHEKIRSIFINLGGGDSGRFYSKVLDGLKQWGREIEVIGIPGFTSWGQEALAQKDWRPLNFRWEKQNIEECLFRADLAITAGGIAAYEALCAGTPLLAISYDSFQQTTLTMLRGSEACVDLGPGDELNPTDLAAALSNVESDVDKRRLLSSRGKQIVDGQGAERVARIVRGAICKSWIEDQ
jgi:spore coat polysaccharide biosynthesis predicted glycosyltransferase SpsG